MSIVQKSRVITIVGGRGKMGQKFADAFLSKGHTVLICDTDDHAQWGDRIGKSDIVMISVPIHVTEDVIAYVAPLMRSGSLLTDITSVKMMPLQVMCKNVAADVEIVGGHPLFGPTVEWIGQHFIMCGERSGIHAKWYRDFLTTLGLQVIDMTAQEHDRHMAVIQCLTHFSNLSLGIALEKMQYDLKTGEQIATAIYQMRLYGAGRILAQDPVLYADIQKFNPFAKEIALTYRASVKELCNAITADDTSTFIALFRRTQKYFGTLTQHSLEVTDRLIAHMTQKS